MARSYKRDSRGRFASTGGGGAKGSGPKGLSPHRQALRNELMARKPQTVAALKAAKAQGGTVRGVGGLTSRFNATRDQAIRSANIAAIGKAGKPPEKAASGATSVAKARGAKARAATSTRAANEATTKRLKAAGQTAVGGRLAKSTAAKYSGTAATKRSRAGGWQAAGHNQKEGVPGYRQGANFAKASPKGTTTRRTRPARKIEPATLPGQKLQHYPRIPVNSPAASKKGPKKRPILDAIARPILKAMSGKKKRKG